MLYKFAKFVAACTVLLILAGSLVTSHDAGLSVPDWPTSYGWNMFTFPPSMWVANILYEHGHRLIASGVGLLTIALAVWLWNAATPRLLKWLGIAAVGAVVAQGLLGGLTVLFFLPPAVSTAHAGLAEIFFCITVSIALLTSPGWKTAPPPIDDGRLRGLATMTTVIVFGQILIGAAMRHMGAGLAIPDFPLMFGRLVPDHWSAGIAIHFAHRAGAIVVALSVTSTAVFIWRNHTDRVEFAQAALVSMILLVIQSTLGSLTVLTRRHVWISSLHVVFGALLLAASLVVTLRSWRAQIADRARMIEGRRGRLKLGPTVADDGVRA
jgi:cytochrome c oxidase assembly protein subunit 15